MKNTLLTTIAAVVLVGCGSSPISYDAAKGNIEAIKQHIDAGTDLNAKDKYGNTPLCLAAFNGQKETAELLIANGAEVNAKSNGDTPLDQAHTGKYLKVNTREGIYKELADLLRKHGGKTKKELEGVEPVAEATTSEPSTAKAPDISLIEAAYKGNIEAAKQAIADGADVNAKTNDGRTPLHLAAENGRKEIAELLLAEGVDVNVKDRDGWTPLRLAAYWGRNETVELLITAGADVNAKNIVGDTPLDFAIRRKHPETADLLRKHGGKSGEELKAEGK